MRKKSMLASDSRYLTMVENAYYQVVPVDSSARSSHIKIRPPLHQYIRHLLFGELGTKGSTNRILKQLRKLNWKDPEVATYAIRCLTSAWKVKFPNIRTLAGVVAELTLYQEFVGHRIVDAVLEDIRWSLEFPISKFNQRRVSMAKYLAELYNYRMVESSVVFKVWHIYISYFQIRTGVIIIVIFFRFCTLASLLVSVLITPLNRIWISQTILCVCAWC